MLYESIHSVSITRTVIVSILTCLTMLPTACNGVVLFTYFKFRCLRTLHDRLLIHLAILNIAVLFGVPFYASSILLPEQVLTSKLLCLLNFSIIRGGMLAATFIYLGLAIERLLCIIYPRKHSRLHSYHVEIWCAISFICGYVYYLLPVFGWNNWDTHKICSRHVVPHLFHSLSEVIIFIPLIANLVINIFIVRAARRQSKKIKLLVRNVRDRHHKKHFRKCYKAYITVFVTSVLTTLCWTPQLIVYILFHRLDSMDITTKRSLVEASFVPVIINSGLSPLIFGMRHKHFKCAMRSIFTKHRHHCVH